MTAMKKAEGAFLTIGELSAELGVPQHILRYWETRFPQLRPLQRAGNRRYYRPADVELARRIHRLLNVEGFTIRGAQKALAGGAVVEGADGEGSVQEDVPVVTEPALVAPGGDAELIARLEIIRARLAAALSADGTSGTRSS